MTISIRFMSCAVVIAATCTSTLYGQPESPSGYYTNAEILRKSYQIALPLPFGHSEVSIKFDGEKVDSLVIVTESLTVDIHSELPGDLELIGEPMISFDDDGVTTEDEIDRFKIRFEIGELYDVLICDCPAPKISCVGQFRDIITFTINSKGQVQREIMDVRSIVGCESRPSDPGIDSDGK